MRPKRPRPFANEMESGIAANDNDRREVDRRTAIDRREMPPRPEGRRRSGGRRDGDPTEV